MSLHRDSLPASTAGQSTNSESAAAIKYLMDELDHTRMRIADLLKAGDQLLAIVGTLAAGLFFTASAIDKIDLRLAAPFVLLVPTAFSLRLNALIQHFGGYRKWLEERINDLLHQEVYRWESTVAPLLKKSYASLLNTVVLGLMWVASCFYAIDGLQRSHLGNASQDLLVAAYLLTAVLLVISLISGQRLFGRAYNACCISDLANSPSSSRDTSVIASLSEIPTMTGSVEAEATQAIPPVPD